MKRNIRNIAYTLILSALSLGTTAAQEATTGPLVLDLQGAVDHAMAHNKSLQNSRLEMEKSDRSIWEAIAQGLPQVSGSVDYMTYFNYEMQFNFGTGSSVEFTAEQMADAYNQTVAVFPSFTPADLANYSAGSYYEGVLASMMPPTSILMSDQATATLQVSQLIFSGQYIVGIQTAKLAKLISEQSYQSSELSIKEAVTSSYYLVLITQSSLDILQKNLEIMEDNLTQTRVMFKTGMAEQTDVDQLQITLNQLENSKKALERNLELNYNMLRFQLGLDATVAITLSDDLESLFSGSDPEMALLSPFKAENNVNYQIMQTQEEISGKMLDLQKWNYGPTLAGFYNYNKKIKTTGFDMNPNNLAGLSLSVPIFSSGMRKAQVDQARIDYNMAQINKSIMEDQLSVQEKQFKYNLQSSLENYETQKENVDVARRVYDNYKRKYEQGMASSLDLTQANANYLDAESNYLQAVLEVMNAKLALDKLNNTL
ncbi:MAG: TolC family protein [Bacteroidales bacterium]